MKTKHILACFLSLILGASVAVAQGNPSSQAKPNVIESVAVTRAGGNTVMKIGLQQPIGVPPSNFVIANPARIVFDFPTTDNGLGHSNKVVNEGILRSYSLVQAADRSRLVLNLDKTVKFEARQEDKNLFITLLEDAQMGVEVSSGTVQHFAKTGKDDTGSVRDIQFRRNKEGAGVILVELSSSDTGIDVKQKGTSLQVSFKKTQLPEALRRKLDVVDFGTPVTLINTKADGENVMMDIVPQGLWEHTAYQSDNQFVVEVKPLKEDPNKLFQGTRKGYQGEAISLNFQNIPLRELLHVFADITNFNIVISDSVGGNVSLRLNDVPWDQALEIVLQQKNLAMRKNGNVIWIAPQDELAARDEQLVKSRELAITAEQPRLEMFQLSYLKAEEFSAMISQKLAPGEKEDKSGSFLSPIGKVTIDSRTNQLFIFDVPTKLEMIGNLLKQVDKPVRQVLIEARIVEATDSFAKNLGARLGVHDQVTDGHRILGGNSPRFAVGGSIIDPAFHTGQIVTSPDLLTDIMGVSLRASNIGTSQVGAFSFSLFNSSKTQFLNLELSALEADGKGKIISSPRVVTADQMEAMIEQGTELPYLQASASGATNVTFKKAVLSLKVRPQITPDGGVIMKLQIHKDAPNPKYAITSYGIAIDTKNVNTDVLVENGGTVVIGGIYTQDETENNTRIPVLGDMPVVGALFRNKERKKERSELLVFITPKIITPEINSMR